MPENRHALADLGWSDRWTALYAEAATPLTLAGRVIRRDRGRARVATEAATVDIEVHGALGEVVTGDWVVVEDGRIAGILPRSGVLRRKGPDSSEQTLAANVDVVLLVCGLDRPVKPGRIHRGAVQAWDAGAEPVVVLSKLDLSNDPEGASAAIAEQTPGVEIIAASTRTGAGLDEVRRRLSGKTAVLLGESGAGKSSLLNGLAGEEVAAEGRVRRGDSKGRHTTTQRELHVLGGGSVVIDTPGIRAFGLAASSEAVGAAFEDVEELAALCRFADCRHSSEPGCAVRQAVEEGSLPQARAEAYERLKRELEHQVLRAKPHERRLEERKFARMAREVQREKRRRNRG